MWYGYTVNDLPETCRVYSVADRAAVLPRWGLFGTGHPPQSTPHTYVVRLCQTERRTRQVVPCSSSSPIMAFVNNDSGSHLKVRELEYSLERSTQASLVRRPRVAACPAVSLRLP